MGAPSSPGVAGTRLHILITEDNFDIRETLRALLLTFGHRVDVAGDGIEGIRMALEQHPEVALIDIGLPIGYQVAARFRAEMSPPPVLIGLSGYGQLDDRSRALAAGFDAYLVKPVRLDDLLRTLTEVGRGTPDLLGLG